MPLYKYMSARAVDFLASCTLRFSPPSDFNDPFDGVPTAAAIVQSPALRELIGYNLDFPADQLAADPELAAGVPIAQKMMEDIARRGYRDRLIDDRNKNFRVLCLSKAAPDSNSAALMWGHYAQDPLNGNKPHAGLALEFDETNPWFASHLGRDDRHYKAVEYRSRRASLSADGTDVLFVKSNLWAYEQEVRLVRYVGASANDLAGADNSIATYPPEMLKTIFIGLYARKGIEAEVGAQLARNAALSHVKVSRILAIDPDEFCFDVAD